MSDLKLSHPSRERLDAFVSGRLDPLEAGAIEDHLHGCVACRSSAAAMGSQSSHDAPTIGMASPEARADNPADAPTIPPLAPGLEAGAIPPALVDHPRYRILKLLGSGGMGAVYQAEHRLMERRVALKVISPSLIGNSAAGERFALEVKAAARLSHPNIVAAYDAEQAGGVHFLVMEFVEGVSLARVIGRRGRLPVIHASDYARQAALGLQHASDKVKIIQAGILIR